MQKHQGKKPSNSEKHISELFQRGLAQHRQGRIKEAAIIYEQVIRVKPTHFDALQLLGTAYAQVGSFTEALAYFDKALAVDDTIALVHVSRGDTLKSLQRPEEAIAAYKQATILQPDFADAYFKLGHALQALNLLEDALLSYEKGIALNPQSATAHYNRGLTLHGLKKLDDAILCYNSAIKLKPDFFEAYNNRGKALHQLAHFDEAYLAYKLLNELKPDSPVAYYNCGIVLQDLKNFEGALDVFNKALALQPNYNHLLGKKLHTHMCLCNWDDLDTQLEDLIHRIKNGENASQPFPLLALIDAPDIHQLASEAYVKFTNPPTNSKVDFPEPAIGSKIRIGYFSSDFGNHPVSHLLAGLFEQHDRNQFEVFAFSLLNRASEPWRERVAKGVDQFIDVSSKTDEQVAELSRSLGIHVAVDLNGHTQHARTGIFAHRAAPIQTSYIGYLGTTGAAYYDYLLADPIVVPEETRHFYTEKIAYLQTYQCNDFKLDVSEMVLGREAFGLPKNAFVFCSFNNNYKITPKVFSSWMNILGKVPGSVLWLYVDNATAKHNLQKEAAQRGIAPYRLVFADKLPFKEHLARQRLGDLYLDTYPYNAGATASNALRVGLPVLTYAGNSFASRYGASLLHALGLPELVTFSLGEYEALAISLATDPKRLIGLKQKLIQNTKNYSLFDTLKFTRNIESLYTQMINKLYPLG